MSIVSKLILERTGVSELVQKSYEVLNGNSPSE